ncbi:MAG: BCCT family transporter [Geminicoccaceae bacterium]|nr:BCCT family transporter [Geminicoccaceae bacterium]HRY24917.1 BCCT family transporter [Geminicoccaceae bacterium]
MSEPVQPDFTVDSTDYEVGQDNVQILGLDIHNPVFMISAVTIVGFVIFTLMFQEGTAAFFGWLRPWLTSTFDWVFMSAANIFVLFCLFLVISPWGRIRLGGADATPDFSYAGWFAMLFAAGMGIGLMFFGVLEPVYHFQNPPLGVNPEDVEAARAMGMAATIFHWGLHPWAIYAVVALSLAFFTFNNGLPLTIRSAFYPLLGDRVWGWPGHIIDTLAVFATLFGLATSLGFGAEQASAGLEYLFGIPATDVTKVALIIAITAVALISVVAGLEAGVKRLSEINMVLALALLLFVIIAGPTIALLTGFFANAGHYAADLLPLSNPFGRDDTAFMHGWTTFYWAWWISWSPFVGMFIARVSRGRTVREFITCVLIIPTLVSILWMTAFGGTAIDQIVNDNYQGVAETVAAYVPELSLFKMLEVLPLTMVSSFLGIVLVIVFFVTSSDSGSLVIDTITAGGKTDAPVAQRVFWATFEGLVAIALLLGGGLASLQGAAIATGFPFAVVLVAMCWCLFKGLRADPQMAR